MKNIIVSVIRIYLIIEEIFFLNKINVEKKINDENTKTIPSNII